MTNKSCPRCKRTLPVLWYFGVPTSFYPNKTKKDGLSTYCRLCHDEYSKNYQKAHPEQHRISQRKYYRKLAERFPWCPRSSEALNDALHVAKFVESFKDAEIVEI